MKRNKKKRGKEDHGNESKLKFNKERGREKKIKATLEDDKKAMEEKDKAIG